MAETQSSTRAPGSQGTQAPQQGRHDTPGQPDPMQETGKELRTQAQALLTQGQEVATEYYEEGRNQIPRVATPTRKPGTAEPAPIRVHRGGDWPAVCLAPAGGKWASRPCHHAGTGVTRLSTHE